MELERESMRATDRLDVASPVKHGTALRIRHRSPLWVKGNFRLRCWTLGRPRPRSLGTFGHNGEGAGRISRCDTQPGTTRRCRHRALMVAPTAGPEPGCSAEEVTRQRWP